MPEPADHRPRQRGPGYVFDGPAELREVDAMLAEYARRSPVPAGLADRVFNASAGLLPARRRRDRVLRLQPVSPVSTWGRLALAASIALAFFVAARVLPFGRPTPLLSPDVELILLEFAGVGDLDEPGYAAVEHLLVTRDMTFRDLTSDLANLVADLEM
jgi:hypothetical protein